MREEMRSEYQVDYSTANRGKHYRRLMREGANVVLLDPDVARAFRDSKSVNDALRALLRVSKRLTRPTSRAKRPRVKRAVGGGT